MNTAQKVFITGGTSGIGAAIARAFAATGASVTATGATPAAVDAAQALSANRLVAVHVLDVRQNEYVQNVLVEFGAFDVLVNCAGIIQRNAEHDPEVFAQTVDINLNGTMRACAAARAGLKARQGSIVNTASMLSFFGGGLTPGYSASKGGVAQLTKSLAIAYAVDGIRVNAVAPGWIATPLTQALQDDATRSAQIVGRTPMGRWGQPEDVAEPVLFLASSAARFITGVVLPVDGGYLIQ